MYNVAGIYVIYAIYAHVSSEEDRQNTDRQVVDL